MITIDRTVFEMAFEVSDGETQAYLDSQTGDILFVERLIPDDLETTIKSAKTLYDALVAVDDRTDISWTGKDALFDYARVHWDADKRYHAIPEMNIYPELTTLSARINRWLEAQGIEAIFSE